MERLKKWWKDVLNEARQSAGGAMNTKTRPKPILTVRVYRAAEDRWYSLEEVNNG